MVTLKEDLSPVMHSRLCSAHALLLLRSCPSATYENNIRLFIIKITCSKTKNGAQHSPRFLRVTTTALRHKVKGNCALNVARLLCFYGNE
jgi:hypothetical protein